MRDLSYVVLKPSDFPVLAEMCKFDPLFPADYARWLALVRSADEQAQAHAGGLHPPSFLLDLEAFQTWCERVSIIPCIDALRAYAIVQRGGRRALGTGGRIVVLARSTLCRLLAHGASRHMLNDDRAGTSHARLLRMMNGVHTARRHRGASRCRHDRTLVASDLLQADSVALDETQCPERGRFSLRYAKFMRTRDARNLRSDAIVAGIQEHFSKSWAL